MGENTGSDDFLADGGEIAARIRATDWSKTPLGPIEGWPRSLKIVLRILLTSRYQMWLGWGPDFLFFYNDAYRPTLGVKEPRALGAPAPALWAEIWADIGPRAEAVVRTGKATWDEGLLLFLERHGFPEETYHTFSYSPVPDDDGGIGGMLSVVIEDTERTIGERRVRTLKELSTATAPARTVARACELAATSLATNAKDLPFALLYLLDEDGKNARLGAGTGLGAASAAAPAVVALSGGDAPSTWPFARVLATRHPVTVGDVRDRFGAIHAGPWPEPVSTAMVLPLALPGQEERLTGFLVAGVSPRRPFDDAYADFLGLVAGQVTSAVADARAYEEEKRRAEALAELDRAKTAFFSNVSHEFRTPLTLMLGPLEDLLSSGEALSPEQRELAAVAHRNGRRLQRLVNTLLDFSRIEAGRMKAVFEPVDLAATTAELASVFRSAIERAGLRLVVDCPPLPEPVFVDRDLWEKIVLNFLSNAFKYTFEGVIAVRLRAVEGRVVLSVSDTGSGIPEHELPNVFNRFHRIEGVRGRTHEGSGIGLALVQELAKLHGGAVSVESVFGEGSTFSVTVPFGRAHLPPDHVVAPRPGAPASLAPSPLVDEALQWLSGEDADVTPPARAAAGERATVLLADDNADMREYVRRLLAAEYDVVAVKDGRAALEAARRRPPDLVLTDVMMPALDGYGLLRALRATPSTAAVPVIMLSARAGEEARIDGLQAGADDYLIKPFSARELLARVGGTLALARARREATRREEELRADTTKILESMTEAFVAVDGDWTFSYVNAAAEEIYGMPREDLLGRTLWDVFPAVRSTAFERVYRRVMGNRVAERLESVYEPFGRAFEVSVCPARDGGLAIYFRDITDRKRAAAIVEGQKRALELAATGAPLADVLEVLTRTVEAQSTRRALASILLVDDDGERLRTGAAPSLPEAYNRAVDGLPISPASGSCGTAAHRRRPVVVDDIATDPIWAGFRALALEHGLRACWSVPLTSARGKILGTFALYYREPCRPSPEDEEVVALLANTAAVLVERDVESRERLLAEEALREADRRKDEFLAVLAHELRNPLAPLRNGLEVMRLAGGETPAVGQARAMMARQLGHLVRLIDDLLDVSRISRNKLDLRRAPVRLADVVASAVETARPVVEDARHTLTVALPGAPVTIDADLTRLAQVFANLLTNSARYTPAGGHIELTGEVRDGWVVVSVRDDGIGIPAAAVPRIFDMFSQVDRSLARSTGGLGIGLALVRALVGMHGGTVEATSPGPGLGSTFTVRLPVMTAPRDPPAAPPKDAVAAAGPRRRVLVVDDNRDSATSMSMMLALRGDEVRTAHDGLEAVEVARTFRPDVVLMDVGMPRLDGYEATRRIRREPWGRDVTIIALTGWGQDADRERSREAGCDAHLVKPVDARDLERFLRAPTRLAP